jgi:N-acetylglutamate synthase-like GNAT family acetyltransferase
MVTINLAKPHNTEAIKTFYSQCGYGGGLNKEDRILIAQLGEEIIGAVRLCPENGFSVLRGMQILAPFQRQGIGTQLLRVCAGQLVDRVCYCIPWQHLRSFYQQVGFQEVSPVEVPALLSKRFDGYIFRGMNVILISRLPDLQ